jgi:hypothetical protein
MDFVQQLNHHPNGSEDDDAAEWKQVAELRAVAEAQDPASFLSLLQPSYPQDFT